MPLSAGKHELTYTNATPFKLAASVAGIPVEIICNRMMSNPTEVENSRAELKGEGTTEFSECSVQKPTGCAVPGSIQTVKLRTHSEVGTTFATVALSECGLLNGSDNVIGSARSETVNTESDEFTATSGSGLSLGGFTAQLTGRYHISTPDGTNVYRQTP